MIEAGQYVFIRGLPVQLLYILAYKDENTAVWLVRPLFVEEPNREEEVNVHTSYTQLHQKPNNWTYATKRAGT